MQGRLLCPHTAVLEVQSELNSQVKTEVEHNVRAELSAWAAFGGA